MGLGHNALRPWLTGRPEVAEALPAGVGATPAPHERADGGPCLLGCPRTRGEDIAGTRREVRRPLPDGIHVTHDMTQEELAQPVGASRETVNKALADFAARGWIRPESRSVILIDPERLDRRSARSPLACRKGASCSSRGTPTAHARLATRVATLRGTSEVDRLHHALREVLDRDAMPT